AIERNIPVGAVDTPLFGRSPASVRALPSPMSTALRFRDHEKFHRVALFTIGAGALCSTASALIAGAAAPRIALPLIAAAVVIGAVMAGGSRLASALWRAGLAAAGAIALLY